MSEPSAHEFTLSSQLEDAIIATYYMEIDAGNDVLTSVRRLTTFIYPGAWTDTAATAESTARHTPTVHGIYETPPFEVSLKSSNTRHFIVQLAFPLIDVDVNLPSLLTSVAGEILAYGNLKLLDLKLPSAFTQAYPGPRFGVKGLRDLLNVQDRPFLLAILKPSQGYTPESGTERFFAAARGGVDIIKDEELLSDPSYCRRVERVKHYLRAEQRAFEETGEHTLYAVNITGSVDRLLLNALEALELGANALMINYLQVGLDATAMICRDPRIHVPILGHSSGATPIYASPSTGMSAPLILATLPRLCGIDMGIVLSSYGSFPHLPERCVAVADAMRHPMHTLRSVLPIVASSVTPARAPDVVSTFGIDVALGAGSSIFGHPQGATAGARAMRQAIDIAVSGQSLYENAATPELQSALALWK